MTCSGPECDRDEAHAGLCLAHYQQKQRGRPLKPLQERDGDRVKFTFRCSAALKKEIERSAKEAGLDAAEFVRQAVKARVLR